MAITLKDMSGKPSIAEMAKGLATQVAEQAKPRSPQIHLIKGAGKSQLLIANSTQLYCISPSVESRLTALLQAQDETGLTQELIALGLDTPIAIDDEPLRSPPIYALSLAIAQKCNMGCTYCYADQGNFGGPMKNMTLDTAKQSIDFLLKEIPEGGNAQLTFLGGEPLINRSALREATVYAHEKSSEKGVKIQFSLTSNGTLIQEEDASFFETYGFSVTISLDGLKKEHDNLRPMKNGAGSYDRIMKKLQPLLDMQRHMQVSARVTVTPENQNLAETLDQFIGMGFHSVGFSPLLKSSSGTKEMSRKDLDNMLQGMIECGLNFERNVLQDKRYPFLNMVNALKEISKGTHRPYPCGAGAGYMGVSADGELSACHRFVNEPRARMGDLHNGIDPKLQNNWLAARHVHTQSPCTQCWARYLCGGGCHHEVLDRGRHACDYIRGWLHYTIQAHDRISRFTPNWNKA
jgi:uncharacterized protein